MDNRLNNNPVYFTIIIPVYNMGYIIEETLQALSKQTLKGFKVLIVDDGSKDNIKEIVDKWQQLGIINIEYIYQDNQGVSAARNNGLNHCRTPYVLFCDADDIMPYNSIEIVKNKIANHDVVAGLASRNLEDAHHLINSFSSREGIDGLMKKFLYDNASLHFCAFAYKLDILNKHKIRFSDDLKYGEDEEFTWKYLCYCKTASFVEIPLYCYRANPQSASNSVSYRRTQVIDSMIRVSDYYRNNNHPFYNALSSMGIPRAKLAILKQFAVNQCKELFIQLLDDSKYSKYKIRNLLSFPDIRIKLASAVLFISPKIFYKLIGKI